MILFENDQTSVSCSQAMMIFGDFTVSVIILSDSSVCWERCFGGDSFVEVDPFSPLDEVVTIFLVMDATTSLGEVVPGVLPFKWNSSAALSHEG